MKNKQSLLSICIPTYNRKNILEKCLKSFINEAYYLNIPVIISDNNSNDWTNILLKNISKKYSNIQYFIQNENKWIDFNMLFVADKCITKYWLWLWDDDLIIKNKLIEILNYLKTNNYDAIFLNYKYKNIIQFDNLNEDLILNSNQLYELFLKNNNLSLWIPYFWSIIFNRKQINIDYNSRYIWTNHLYFWSILDYIKDKKKILFTKDIFILLDEFKIKKTWNNTLVKIYCNDILEFYNKIDNSYKLEKYKNNYIKNTFSIINIIYLKLYNTDKFDNIIYNKIAFKNFKNHTKYIWFLQKINYILVCLLPLFILKILNICYQKTKKYL